MKGSEVLKELENGKRLTSSCVTDSGYNYIYKSDNNEFKSNTGSNLKIPVCNFYEFEWSIFKEEELDAWKAFSKIMKKIETVFPSYVQQPKYLEISVLVKSDDNAMLIKEEIRR